MAIATDLGQLTPEVHTALSGAALVELEANYDLYSLRYGSYPYYLKRRIESPWGHLDNAECAAKILELVQEGCESLRCATSARRTTPRAGAGGQCSRRFWRRGLCGAGRAGAGPAPQRAQRVDGVLSNAEDRPDLRGQAECGLLCGRCGRVSKSAWAPCAISALWSFPRRPSLKKCRRGGDPEGAEKRGRPFWPACEKGAYLVALCVEGKPISSEELAALVAQRALGGTGDIAFVIGSSTGWRRR